MITFDNLRDLLKINRSVRRFDGSKSVGAEILKQLVELTRYCASARNMQPLRYRLVSTPEECGGLFPALKWAGYLTDWAGPSEEERPTAYLVQCLDTELAGNCLCDDGLHLEALTLGASALRINGCIIKAFNAAEVVRSLAIPERYKPLYVLALGYPAEKVEIISTDGTSQADIRYFRDDADVHIVPKRPLEELIIS